MKKTVLFLGILLFTRGGAWADTKIGEIGVRATQHPFGVIRATLPLPPGESIANGKRPYGIVDANGATVPAQVELVSQYPNGDPRVVEILAKLNRPANAQPGQAIKYDVVKLSSPLQPPGNTTALLTAFLNNLSSGGVPLKDAIQFSHRDVFGIEYRGKLFDPLYVDGSKTIDQGDVRNTIRVSLALRPDPTKPVGPPNGAEPRGLVFRTYLQVLADNPDAALVTLHIHNGANGLNPNSPYDNWVRKLYFDQVTVSVPTGWELVEKYKSPLFGSPNAQGNLTVYPIIKANTDGTFHLFQPQDQIERRYILRRVGNAQSAGLLKDDGLGFVRKGTNANGVKWWSWWSLNAYYPQAIRLPDLSFYPNPQSGCQKIAGLLAAEKSYLENGTSGGLHITGNDGPFHAMTSYNQGMTGGTLIHQYEAMGIHAAYGCPEAIQLMELQQRGIIGSREPNALYNLDGSPTTAAQLKAGNTLPVQLNVGLNVNVKKFDPFKSKQANTHHEAYVAAHNLQPAYETQHLKFKPIDLQHFSRVINAPQVLTWLGNDPAGKDFLLAYGNLVQLHSHFSPTHYKGGQPVYAELGKIKPFTMPPRGYGGSHIGRATAWTIQTGMAAYAIGDVAYRTQTKVWADDVAYIMEGMQTCNGIWQATYNAGKLFQTARGAQIFENLLLLFSLKGILESVYEGAGAQPSPAQNLLIATLSRGAYGIFTNPMNLAVGPNGPTANNVVKVAISDYAPQPQNLLWQPPYCGENQPHASGVKTAGHFYVMSPLAHSYEVTQDPVFLQQAAKLHGTPIGDLNALHLKLQQKWISKPLDGSNGVALLSLVQELLGY